MRVFRYIRGLTWMAYHFGVATTIRYERGRRAGATIDYDAGFSRDELAKIGEHFDPAPWEQSRGETS